MSDVSYPVEMISGLPVVTAPAEIDVTTADQLRLVLLEAGARGHTTVVVDMTRTEFCDSAGLGVLIRAHKRALEEGGELRLVMPAGGAVFRIFTLTSLYRFIPRFGNLPEALLQRPAVAIRPLRPQPSTPLGRLVRQPAWPHGDREPAGQGMLKASVADGVSGPVITPMVPPAPSTATVSAARADRPADVRLCVIPLSFTFGSGDPSRLPRGQRLTTWPGRPAPAGLPPCETGRQAGDACRDRGEPSVVGGTRRRGAGRPHGLVLQSGGQ